MIDTRGIGDAVFSRRDLRRYRLSKASDVCKRATGEAPTVQQVIGILRRLVPGAAISAAPEPMLHTAGFPMPREGTLDTDRDRRPT